MIAHGMRFRTFSIPSLRSCCGLIITQLTAKAMSHVTNSMPAAVHGLVLIGFFVLTVSIPFRGSKANAGHWGSSSAYEGPLRPMQSYAVAALCCCTVCRAFLNDPGVELPPWRTDPGAVAADDPGHEGEGPGRQRQRGTVEKHGSPWWW
jgi:hypothetical protein